MYSITVCVLFACVKFYYSVSYMVGPGGLANGRFDALCYKTVHAQVYKFMFDKYQCYQFLDLCYM